MKLSLGSFPAITDRTIAASVNDRVMGPTVSWCSDIGITDKFNKLSHKTFMNVNYLPPARETRPTVGLIPAKLLLLAGHIILPSVSVPKVTAASPMEAATPDPDEDPHGSAFLKYAFVHCPPLPDHPGARSPLWCENSDRLVFPKHRNISNWLEYKYFLHAPKIIAPAFLKRLTTPASSGTIDPKRLKDPAVVFIPEENLSTGHQNHTGTRADPQKQPLPCYPDKNKTR